MSIVLCVATLNKKSAIPSDAVQNTFMYQTATTPPTTTELDNISDAIEDFYNDLQTSTFRVCNYMSHSLSTTTNANTIAFYDITTHLDGSPHGSPIRVDQWSLTATGTGIPLPDECAMVLTYHRGYGADVEFSGTTRPRARDRGRLYVGPLDIGAVDAVTPLFEPIPNATFLSTITQAGTRLRLNTDAGTAFWLQWSRVNASVDAVQGGWVDNAFDTQRRRGNKPTARTAI